MDILSELLQDRSKEHIQQIADYIGSDTKKYRKLWKLVQSDDDIISQRAAWVLDHCTLSRTEAVLPFLPEMIEEMKKPVSEAVKRNVMKLISEAPSIPEDQSASLFDLCLNWVIDKHTPIAVKVHCMQTAAKIALPFPELREEVRLVIEEQMKHGSAGIRSRGRKLLGLLAVDL
jgi:sugar-specific transcriptional regulator TrmB